MTMGNQKRVGLAFQGGGFPAGAIGAGVVKRLVEAGAFKEYDIDVFSGTSAGALVAAVCWGHQLKGEIEKAPETLEKQWLHFAWGLLPDAKMVQMAQLSDSLARMNPVYEFYAENMVVPMLRCFFNEWVNTYIPIEPLKTLKSRSKHIPGLLMGAADVLSGEIKVFTEDDFGLEAITASGSLDEVNGLTEIKEGSNKGVYCDGAWGTDPPIDPLIDYDIDEIWFVEIFPKERQQIPKTPAERKDRKDELWQNSLAEHELRYIRKVNQWLEQGRLVNDPKRKGDPDYKTYRQITVKKMPMLLDLPAGAAFVNSPSFLREMMAYGYKYAGLFLMDSLTYKWQVGNGLALDYLEYTVDITPGPQGKFTFRRHEDLSQPPAWTKEFIPDEVELAKLYGLMVGKGVFTRKWQPRQGATEGGGQESLTLTMLGQDYAIPGQLEPEEAAIASEIYTALESLVPGEIWAKFMAQHKEYGPVHRLLSF
jgi:NTE family protein